MGKTIAGVGKGRVRGALAHVETNDVRLWHAASCEERVPARPRHLAAMMTTTMQECETQLKVER